MKRIRITKPVHGESIAQKGYKVGYQDGLNRKYEVSKDRPTFKPKELLYATGETLNESCIRYELKITRIARNTFRVESNDLDFGELPDLTINSGETLTLNIPAKVEITL